jgi:hypothetical protein
MEAAFLIIDFSLLFWPNARATTLMMPFLELYNPGFRSGYISLWVCAISKIKTASNFFPAGVFFILITLANGLLVLRT